MANHETVRTDEQSVILSARLYKVEELALLLRVTERTIRKYCAERVFANAIKLGGGRRWLVPGADVIALCPVLEHPRTK